MKNRVIADSKYAKTPVISMEKPRLKGTEMAW
jgi:hypothetical protein